MVTEVDPPTSHVGSVPGQGREIPVRRVLLVGAGVTATVYAVAWLMIRGSVAVPTAVEALAVWAWGCVAVVLVLLGLATLGLAAVLTLAAVCHLFASPRGDGARLLGMAIALAAVGLTLILGPRFATAPLLEGISLASYTTRLLC